MKDIEKIMQIIQSVQNFYPLFVVNVKEKEVKRKMEELAEEIRNQLKDPKLLEIFAWLWGYMVFENTRKKILLTIEEELIDELSED